MEDLKRQIRAYLAESFVYDLDTLKYDELKYIADYMSSLNEVSRNFRINRLTSDEVKLEIGVEGGIAVIK